MMVVDGLELSWEDRDDFEDESAAENADDINVSAYDFDSLSIAPSDWTVSTIYDLIGRQLQLDPAYQRRNVWRQKAKSQFIESLLLGIPIPQILLASKTGQKNAFLVLDGKQRLTTIKEFIDGRFYDGRIFRLRDLRILKQLEGKSWDDLQLIDDWADRLKNEPLRTTVLRGWSSESVLYEIFYRLNSGSVKLSPMELRMSLLPGDFLKFIIAWTEIIGPIHHILSKRQPDPRMSDVELAIRYLAFRDQKTQYSGDLKKFLDEFCDEKNTEFARDVYQEQYYFRLLNDMNAGIEVGIAEFGSKRFCRKYTASGYESRFNRAVFDVLVGALAHADVRQWVEANPNEMEGQYQAVCLQHPEFIKAIESTTKSPEATRTRFEIWFSRVEVLTGIKLHIPDIK